MKKLIIIPAVLLALAMTINAQIPNAGFETWTTFGSYEEPDGWATMNPACAGPFYSCTKSADHYEGNYSIRLENNTSLTQYTGGYGMAITDTMAYPFQPAFAVTGQPNTLSGYYKYTSLNNDTMFIRIVSFKNSIMLGYNTFKTGTSTTNWTGFDLPLTYPAADSATIYFSAFSPSSQVDGPNGNSVLYVDDLRLQNVAVNDRVRALKNTVFNLSPNPASRLVTVDMADLGRRDLAVNIYHLTGRLIRTAALGPNRQQMDISDLANGVYLVEIKGKEWTGKQKLLIQNY